MTAHKFSATTRVALALLFAISLAACGQDEEDTGTGINDILDGDPIPVELPGTWNATSLVFTPIGGGAEVDAVAGGGTLTLLLRDGGSYVLTSKDPGALEEQEVGIYALTGGLIEFLNTDIPDDSPGVFGWLLSGDMLTIQRDTGDDEFDFNGDGVATPAATVLVMQRG